MSERDTFTPPNDPSHENTASGGDHPAGLSVGAIHIDNFRRTNDLEDIAHAHLRLHPHILEHAKKEGKDIVAFAKSHGRGLLVSAGIALLAGSIVIYEYEKHKPGKTTPPKK